MDLRPATDDDEAALVELANEGQPEPITLEDWLRHRSGRDPSDFVVEVLAEDRDRCLLGSLDIMRNPWEKPGWLQVIVKVRRAEQRGGIGRALWAEAERHFERLRPKMLTTGIRDDDPASRAWAERRGFSEWAHRFQSVLDLSSFDASRFASVVEAVEASGLRLATVAEMGPEVMDRFFELHARVVMTTPDFVDAQPPDRRGFDRFFANADIHPPELSVLALDGDRLVGESTVTRRSGGFFYTTFTGVDPDYQGRGLALALKLRTIELARADGATRLGTNNLSINAPILSVNRRLGYEPQPGIWLMRNPVGAASAQR